MSGSVIKVEGLSKKYIIGHQVKDRYETLRDKLAHMGRGFAERLLHPLSPNREIIETEEFWALKDISFDVKIGDRIGIIGRNGAGKTTLLKILSRITEPTSGRVTIKGRVASLLEVGTGFHPELTGRENVFLNGAILGMSKKEITKKFDEIVAFAEVEKFLDTPVKRYSSGMYVRLAFAVAAHLEPEILIVDEVLAVGDAQFQKKCLGKMQDISSEGRTVLFVSHNMGMINDLCSKSILLSEGRVVRTGTTQNVIKYYIEDANSISKEGYTVLNKSDCDIFFKKIYAINDHGMGTNNFAHNESININLECIVNQWVPSSILGFYIVDQRGRKVFTNNSDKWPATFSNGEVINMTVTIPQNFLVPGQYYLTFVISLRRVSVIDIAENSLLINIIDVGSAFSAAPEGHDYGCVFADCHWELN